jgi:aminopeptidase-like protein
MNNRLIIKKFYNFSKNKLYFINRSITGKGLKKTLFLIKKEFRQLKIKKIKSGKKVFDWTIPAEWNVSNAYVKDFKKKIIIDFKKNNLHLMGYAVPIKKILTRDKLLKNLYSIKKYPDAIPYITSYYKKNWGFCISYKNKEELKKKYNRDDKFFVNINSNFKKNGELNYGEVVLKGKSKQEILVSTYICHPSMANNELSGPIVSMSLIKYFMKNKINKTLRFIFIPETIGSITYLKKNLTYLKKNVIGGYNLTCIGDNLSHSCMLTKYGNSLADDSLISAYKKLNIKYKIYSFLKRGSDERQYNSPGIDLPIASIFRSKYHEYKEYHTSMDDFKLVTEKGIYGGFKVAKTAIEILSKKIIPKNILLCEPNLGKRNLYPKISNFHQKKKIKKYLDFLQFSDGMNDIIKIKKKIKVSNKEIYDIMKTLKKNNLINV